MRKDLAKLSYSKVVKSGDTLEVYGFTSPVLIDAGFRAGSVRGVGAKDVYDSNIYRMKQTVRRLIWANALKWLSPSGKPFLPVFITLTYAGKMTEPKESARNFTNFIKRLNYDVFGTKRASLAYLAVCEFQSDFDYHGRRKKGGGNVHYHCIVFNLPYIDNIYDFVADRWQNGYVNIKTVKGKDGLVKYMTKYMTKDLTDVRLMGLKRYYRSRNLYAPVDMRENLVYSQFDGIDPSVEYSYDTDFLGEVSYKRYDLSKDELPIEYWVYGEQIF